MVRRSGAGIVLFCIVLQVGLTWAGQLRFPTLLGTDAYYLLVQAQSVLDTGSLKIPDRDPIPFLMAAFMRSGMMGEGAFQLTIAIIHGLMIGSLVSLLVRLSWGRGVALGIFALLVGESIGLYHVFQFPKLSLALAISFAAVTAYQDHSLWRIFSIVLFVAAVLVHPAVWPIAVLCIGFLLYSDVNFGKYRLAMAWSFLVAILASAGFILLSQGSGILDRYREAAGGSGLVVFMGRSNVPGFLQVEVSILMVFMFSVVCMSLTRKKYGEAGVCFALVSLTLLPTSTNELFGLGERMVLVVAISALPIWMMIFRRSDDNVDDKARLKIWAIVVSVLLASLVWQQALFRDSLAMVDYGKSKAVIDYVSPKKPEMLIARRSLSFYYTALTGRDAFIFDPDPGWDRRKVWRVAFRVDVGEILHFAPAYCSLEPGLAETIPHTDAVFIREDCWESFRDKVSKDELPGLWERVWNDESNPSKPRPKFLKDRHSTS